MIIYNFSNFHLIIDYYKDKLGNEKVAYLSPTNSENGEFGLPKWKTFGEAVKGLNKNKQH